MMKNRRSISVCVVLSLLVACRATSAQNPDLSKLVEEVWETRMRENPLQASRTGDMRFNDKLPRVSLADADRRIATTREQLQALQRIQRDTLNAADRVNHELLERSLQNAIREHDFQMQLIPITNRGGFHIGFPELALQTRFSEKKDFEDYISRLRGFKPYAEGHIEILREGVAKGMTLPAVVLEGFEETIDAHIVDAANKSELYKPFLEKHASLSDSDYEQLCEDAKSAIMESVVPGYAAFGKFMKTEYMPKAREAIGASALTNGRDFYRHRVKQFTTLDVLPEEVHQIGLDEVKRIRGEMAKIIAEVEFDGDFPAFLEFLRTDERFYATSAEDLLRAVARTTKEVDGQLPRLFKTLPRTPYGIREVPAYVAPKTTTAYYMPPAGDGTEAGFYYVNTYNLKSRPLYEIEALSLHEAVPGHHLQIALQQEQGELPKFRRYDGLTAFIEGWALYAERLGLEMGMYDDPYDNFGRLTYEMWRATRLVVDTGIHYMGWTREKAINFMAENSALSLHNIRAEVDRYISWPGQALAYKMGELKIRELRAKAERELGSNFDVREFHDVILGAGPITLTMLEDRVNTWINNNPK